jgi:outer membrane protein insertion porin family
VRLVVRALIALGVLLICAPAGAQDEAELRPIANIIIERAATPENPEPAPLDADTIQEVRNNIRSREGNPFRAQTAAEDLHNLTRLAKFGEPSRTEVQVLADGSVNLYFKLTLQPIILDVQVRGNRQISDQDIADVTSPLIGTPVDPFRLDQFARAVEELYRQEGYNLVSVLPVTENVEETGTLIFTIREGQRLRVRDIRFEAVDEADGLDFAPRELRKDLRTREAGILETGPLLEDVLTEDVRTLRDFYLDRGYLDVRVDRRVQTSQNEKEAIVTFLIVEGGRYTLRDIKVVYPDRRLPELYDTYEDALEARGPSQGIDQFPDASGELKFGIYDYGVFTPEQIIGMLDMKPGDAFSERKKRGIVDTIQSFYGQMGYVEMTDPQSLNVILTEIREEPWVQLVITIYESERFKVGEVIVTGNPHTKQGVVLRENDKLRPGRPFDMTYMEEVRNRLNRLGDPQVPLFERGSVKLTPQAPDDVEPKYRDLLIEVKDTNTGSINLGASFGSDNGLVGQLSVTQYNWDWTDTPDSLGELLSGRAFRGAGQTVSIDLLPGTEVEEYSASFTDPHIFGTDYSFSTRAFYAQRDFTEFDEERYGGRFGIGRRFGSRWEGAVNVRFDWVELSNIDDSRPVDLFEVEDLNLVDGLGLSLRRSSQDDPYVPTRGNRIQLAIEQVGVFGGDFDFTKLNAEYSVYIPVYEDFTGRNTVVSFTTSVDYIPQGQDNVPTYERYYRGGRTFRGFDFRTISPKGFDRNGVLTDDPVGGSFAFFAGAELRQPVYKETLALAFFVDSGTVQEEPGFEDYRVSAGLGLRLRVPGLSPVPLAFDFGFPIVKRFGDEERVFSFSIDIPFGR